MSDPLVHRHDPAAASPAGGASESAHPARSRVDAHATDEATRVVTLAQLLAAEAADSAPPPPPETGTPTRAEVGGPLGPEPTRYGDWEKGGRCIDF